MTESYIIFKIVLEMSRRPLLPQPGAHCRCADTHHLFSGGWPQASAGLWDSTVAHAHVSTLLSAFSTMLQRPFLYPCTGFLSPCSTAHSVRACARAHAGTHRHTRAHTPCLFTGVQLHVCGLPWLDSPFHPSGLFHSTPSSPPWLLSCLAYPTPGPGLGACTF